jgi:hypothetical protein
MTLLGHLYRISLECVAKPGPVPAAGHSGSFVTGAFSVLSS